MQQSESYAWLRSASPQTIRVINAQGVGAYEDWRLRMHDLQERRDIATASCGDTICPNAAASVAGNAAVELAIITAIWPEEPAAVLRASWQ